MTKSDFIILQVFFMGKINKDKHSLFDAAEYFIIISVQSPKTYARTNKKGVFNQNGGQPDFS